MTNALRLIEDTNVVQFAPKSTFNEGWEARVGQMKKRGDGREKTRKLWEKAEKRVGPARLLEALKRYLREEKEPTCGYPGLSVWLNGERYDHWLVDASVAIVAANRPRFPDPYRGSLVLALGEPFVLSYIDQCSLADETVLVVPKGKATAKARIMEKRAELKRAGLTAMRDGE